MIVPVNEVLASPITIILTLTCVHFLIQVIIYNFILDSRSITNLSRALFSGYNPLTIVLSPSLLILLTFLVSEYVNLKIDISQLWILSISMYVMGSAFMMVIGRLRLVLTFRWFFYNISALILASATVHAINQSSLGINIKFYAGVWILLFACVFWLTLLNYGHEFYYQNALASSLYKKYRKKYQSLIRVEIMAVPELVDIFFTIMTIEQINRPGVFRSFERMLFFTGKITTTGIMQVSSKKYLSNTESILAAQGIVLKQYKSYKSGNTGNRSLVSSIAFIYNPADSYIDMINGAYSYLTSLD